MSSALRGSNSERALLNASFGNGLSGSLETEVPLSHVPLSSPRTPATPRHPYHNFRLAAAAVIMAVFLATMAALVAATVVRCRREGGAGCLIPKKAVPLPWGGVSLWDPHLTVSRIAFGSCSAYDIRNQSVWDQGVMPSQPDAWVWLGDMYYGDEPLFNCNPANSNASACACEATYMRQPPYMCPAGELDNARDKMVAQVHQPGYRAFLRYSCPGHEAATGGAMVPPGDDLAVCPRPVLGVYDDHDYGVYLDALGVAADSPRRAAHRGIQWHYRLNPDTQQEVDLVLLDERYERAPLPCEIRGDWCRNVVLKDRQHPSRAWCDDYLRTGGATGRNGSCCKADGAIFYGWCKEAGSQGDPLWDVACNYSSPQFGMQPLVVHEGRLQPRDVEEDAAESEEDSSFCELLGPRQRAWLDGVLAEARAPVKLIASGSVLFGSTGLGENSKENDWTGRCSGDDWDCYRPAQLALLQTLQRHARQHGGCWIVLTGDYHFSDIKVASPGSGHPYSQAYDTANWVTPIYQVMASGMTNSTARPAAPCDGYRKEHSGLRVEGDCGFVKLAAFGMLDFDWAQRRLSMQIRGAEAPHGSAVLQQLTISLDTCQPVEGR
ncbi:hypothetical protein CHLNCDRAFT_137864 [Chlorella variabilis]|uniref:PhoD-like phosphatase metallophosphatase domain-containing protein n=1 Tax=Chlorella variabilis TaxID=554065 RepID=E1Z4P4_CHLVA|nr:hypothetical protein CHLNCDRAFT_137864 [Chlorella variabilis]EFN59092.1 hypothetical protein CHLNCDRAFT_137864 [Chlorella variabilis]|eukprot:XP_005851194.1 hypothetical protein CHLNCDRAFT_137864 [Chlorella variabilis]